MIFKENTSSTSELILPPITSQKLEIPVQTNSQEEIKQDINTEQIKESVDNSEQKKNQESESPFDIFNFLLFFICEVRLNF